MAQVNVMQIGIGFHARRIYIPALLRLSDRLSVGLKAGVDVEPARAVIESYLASNNIAIEMCYFEPFDGDLPTALQDQLDNLVRQHEINAVIISTDPTTHKPYAKWALDRGLHILMDKPITTRSGVSHSVKQASALEDDYIELLNLYQSLQKNKDTVFSVNVQRRYEEGYAKTFSLIKEVASRFNAPVTSIQAMHSDGVWIFPDEIVDQVSHPYSTGYGKCSHSGYHIFDAIWQFYRASGLAEKRADSGEVMTSFLSPRGLLKQFGQKDFASYFADYHKTARRSEDELWDAFDEFGEIDAFSLIRLRKDGETICNISSNLIHNGFSRRGWSVPNEDLYKGNGRVKHQSYSIQQGPFQNIQIHQYQSDDKHEKNDVSEYELGGNNHFDIYVFRNAAMFGSDEKPFVKYSLKDLDKDGAFDDSRLYNETAKDRVITEFIQFITGQISKEALRSNIDTHAVPVKMMSAIYRSHAQQTQKGTPLAEFSIGKDD
jgi:hypothetical protein